MDIVGTAGDVIFTVGMVLDDEGIPTFLLRTDQVGRQSLAIPHRDPHVPFNPDLVLWSHGVGESASGMALDHPGKQSGSLRDDGLGVSDRAVTLRERFCQARQLPIRRIYIV